MGDKFNIVLSMSLPIRVMIDSIIGSVCQRAGQARTARGEGRGQTDLSLISVLPLTNCASFFQNDVNSVKSNIIALPKITKSADIPGTPIARLHGVKDKTGVFLQHAH